MKVILYIPRDKELKHLNFLEQITNNVLPEDAMEKFSFFRNNMDNLDLLQIIISTELYFDLVASEAAYRAYLARLTKPRYIVDERVGCIAIMDTHDAEYKEEYKGLNDELGGVVEFRMGEKIGTNSGTHWVVTKEKRAHMYDLCAKYNMGLIEEHNG